MSNEEDFKPVPILIAVVLIGLLIFIFARNKDSKEITKPASETSQATSVKGEDLKNQLDEVLSALRYFHYISVNDKELDNPNTVVLDVLTEAMNDLNKLKYLQIKTQNLDKSSNEAVSITGLSIKTSVQLMIPIYESWIQYLRGVDINNVSVSEFQYQTAKFNTSTHDIYLKLVENSSLLPFATIEFGESGAQNIVNEDLKAHFLAKIDELFADIFADDDQFYRETKNKYAVAVLVRGYKDFYTR